MRFFPPNRYALDAALTRLNSNVAKAAQDYRPSESPEDHVARICQVMDAGAAEITDADGQRMHKTYQHVWDWLGRKLTGRADFGGTQSKWDALLIDMENRLNDVSKEFRERHVKELAGTNTHIASILDSSEPEEAKKRKIGMGYMKAYDELKALIGAKHNALDRLHDNAMGQACDIIVTHENLELRWRVQASLEWSRSHRPPVRSAPPSAGSPYRKPVRLPPGFFASI